MCSLKVGVLVPVDCLLFLHVLNKIELKMRCVEASHAVRGSFSLCLHPDHEGR